MQLDMSYPVFFAIFFIIIFISFVLAMVKLLYEGSSRRNEWNEYPIWCLLPSVILFLASTASFIMSLVITTHIMYRTGLFQN